MASQGLADEISLLHLLMPNPRESRVRPPCCSSVSNRHACFMLKGLSYVRTVHGLLCALVVPPDVVALVSQPRDVLTENLRRGSWGLERSHGREEKVRESKADRDGNREEASSSSSSRRRRHCVVGQQTAGRQRSKATSLVAREISCNVHKRSAKDCAAVSGTRCVKSRMRCRGVAQDGTVCVLVPWNNSRTSWCCECGKFGKFAVHTCRHPTSTIHDGDRLHSM